ncbi:MAG: type II toxin-antitoxin system RelE/ParE family toxin [Pseudomonadota bacterium]
MPSPKPLKLIISLPAKDDLRDIAQYTITNYGEKQMDIYLQTLYDAMLLLTENPNIGHSREDLLENYQILNVENHVLVFTIQESSIIIVRIIHQSRDIYKL